MAASDFCLSRPFPLTLSVLSFILTDATATVAVVAVFFLVNHLILTLISHRWLPPPPSASSIRLPLYQLVSHSSLLLARVLARLPFLHLPSSSPRSTSVSISTGSEQQRRGRTRQGHHSTLALPCISPTTTAAVRREPGTKWSIYWLNEKIAFFDCKRTLHLMCVMQRPRPVMGSASLLSGETRK